MRLQAHDGAAVETHVSGVSSQEAVEKVEDRRLSRAVGADDPKDCALADVEADVLNRLEPAERLGQLPYAQ